MLYEVKNIKGWYVLHKDNKPYVFMHKLKFLTIDDLKDLAHKATDLTAFQCVQIYRACDRYQKTAGDYFKNPKSPFDAGSDGHDACWIQFPSLYAIECDGVDGIDTPRQVHATDVAFWGRLLQSMPLNIQAEINSHATMGYFIEDMEFMLNDSIGGDGVDERPKKRKSYVPNFAARLKKALDGSGVCYEGVCYDGVENE